MGSLVAAATGRSLGRTPMALNLTVQMFRAGQSVGQHQFSSSSHRVLKIGKLASAHLPVNEPEVSRIHAVIEMSHTSATLIDMGSQVGTVVNGSRVAKAQLKDGDQLIIGSTGFLIGIEVEPLAAAARARAAPAQAPVAAQPTPAPPMPPMPQAAAPMAQPMAQPVPQPMPQPVPQPVMQPPGDLSTQHQRIFAKLQSMSAESLHQVEAYIDFMGARPGAVAPPMPGAPVGAPQGELAADLDDVPAPRPPLDTDHMIRVMGLSNRRTKLIVGGGAAGLAVLTIIFIMAVSNNDQPVTTFIPGEEPARAGETEAGNTATGEAEAGARTEPTGEPTGKTPGQAQPAKRDSNFFYLTLANPVSLKSLAVDLWKGDTHAALLLEHNRTALTTDAELPAGTVVKVPRASHYTVATGDTLGAVAARTLGDPMLYPLLQEANEPILHGTANIDIGMALAVPLIHAAVEKRLRELDAPATP